MAEDWQEIQDKLGTVDTVSGMAQSLSQRITELRQQAGAPALEINAQLMRAAQDDAWRLQAQEDVSDDATEQAKKFGYEAKRVEFVVVVGSDSGTPEAPADISALVTQDATPRDRGLLQDHDFNEVGIGVGGSCYGLFAVVYLGSRTAAPGPNP